MKADKAAAIRANLDRADNSLDAAEALFERGQADFAASRAYFAVFYAATAALLEKDLRFHKRGEVELAIHQHFIWPGLVETHHGRRLNWLLEIRTLADYGGTRHVKPDDARRSIEIARETAAALRLQCISA